MPREPIPTVVRRLAKELAEPIPMRRGSVSERFMKCGQKECRCQYDPQARHGRHAVAASFRRVADEAVRLIMRDVVPLK